MLFGVAVRAQPRDAPFTVEPLVGLSLALQSGDHDCFAAGAFGQDIPIAFCDSPHFESDTSFGHNDFVPANSSLRQTVPSSRACRNSGGGALLHRNPFTCQRELD